LQTVFVSEIANFLNPQSDSRNGRTTEQQSNFRADRHGRQIFGKAVWLSLRKNKRAAKPTHKPTQFAAHLFLPNRTKTITVLTIFAIK